jgi:tetratricopeptide (TPR) repeat protein
MLRIIVIAIVSIVPYSRAMWMRAETAAVPVDRVLTNLNPQLLRQTNDFEVLHAIARLHSLSYSRAASNWSVQVITNIPGAPRRSGELQNGMPWFDHDLPLPPKSVTAPTNPEIRIEARKHLLAAIDFYQRAIRARPTNQFVFIGLAWCQIQAGQPDAAKLALRRAIELDNMPTNKWDTLYPTTATEEAISYLMPLLDPKKDQDERARLLNLKSEVEQFRKSHFKVTPLVLPLRPNLRASDLIDSNAAVAFDLDGTQTPGRKWQWITTNAAWIVHLPQGGPVTSALQTFGNVTFWMFWQNGYHALASLDDDADGLLTGKELRGIRLWQDRNSDGICTPDEILELHQLGITAFDTRYTDQNQTLTSPNGAAFSDGSSRPTYDLILHQQPSSRPLIPTKHLK